MVNSYINSDKLSQAIITAFVIASGLDIISTRLSMTNQYSSEANPIMAFVINNLFLFVAVKLLVVAVIYILYRLNKKYSEYLFGYNIAGIIILAGYSIAILNNFSVWARGVNLW